MAQITEVRVRLLEGDGKVKAVASVTFDGEFAVHGVRVVEGPNGEFVAMPATRTGGGDYRDVFHPVTAEARERLLDAVCRAYVEDAARAAQAPKKGRSKKAG